MMNKTFLIAIFLSISLFFACGSLGTNGQFYKAGTYKGSGDGYFGLINLTVTVTENAITDVRILSHADTEGIGTMAFEELTQSVIYTNSPDVDVIAGATGSSEGFLDAVNDALLAAKVE